MTERRDEPVTGDVIEDGVGPGLLVGVERDRRPGRKGSRLPWFGIFLVVFGALLLLRLWFPALATMGSLLFLAVGVAFLVSWVVNRGWGRSTSGRSSSRSRRRTCCRRRRTGPVGPRDPVPRRRLPVHRAGSRDQRRGRRLAGGPRRDSRADRGVVLRRPGLLRPVLAGHPAGAGRLRPRAGDHGASLRARRLTTRTRR